jgi:LuxR family maltose regulon positive regulatory protein
VFIVALDDHRHWYRYHHLFADALRARLAAQSPHRVAELHRAASDWYAAHDMNAEAVGHALSGEDPAHAADLVESVLPDLRRERRDVQLRDWLIALPAEVVRDRPLLGAYLASARMLSGDLAGVEAALVDAETALARNPPVAAAGASDATVEELRTLPATMAIFRASAAQARGDTGATQQHARKALELCGPNDNMARGGALGFLGLAAWARGDLIEAVDTFSEAVLSMGQAGDVTDQLGSTVPLADMWAARGRPDEARRLLERALAAAQDHPGAALASLGDLHVGVADVLVEQGELVAAAERLEAATVVGESASLLENRYRWYVAMARLRRAQDDIDGAVELLDKAHQVHLPGFFPEVRPIHAQKAQLRITQGRLGEAAQWATDHQVAQIDDPSYLEEFGQLTLVRLLLAQHRADADSSRLDEVALRLERLVPGASSGGRGGSLLEIQILRALMHQARGAPAEAAAELGAALRTGAAAGYLRLFVDEGAPMQELLHAVEPPPDARRYADTLRQVATRAPAVPGRVIGAEGLSEREVEVLRLLATARSGPEIARELFVSVNTLRTHTKHIFTKLEVNTRRAAVSRATDLGLL